MAFYADASPTATPQPSPTGNDASWLIGVAASIAGNIIMAVGILAQKRSLTQNSQLKIELQKPFFKQWLWVLGWITYSIGAGGNSLGLYFASSAIIAPLGSVMLVANLILSPIFLHEICSRRDFLSIMLIITGTTLIVIFGHHAEQEFTLQQLLDMYIQFPFILFAALIVAIVLIAYISVKIIETRAKTLLTRQFKAQHKYLTFLAFSYTAFGAFFSSMQVLLGKSVAELLRKTFSDDNQFLYVWTYFILGGIIITNISEVYWMQRALNTFDALFVVPVKQVTVTFLSVIGTSLYFNEFASFSLQQAILFPTGIVINVVGVYIITTRTMNHCWINKDLRKDVLVVEILNQIGYYNGTFDNAPAVKLPLGYKYPKLLSALKAAMNKKPERQRPDSGVFSDRNSPRSAGTLHRRYQNNNGNDNANAADYGFRQAVQNLGAIDDPTSNSVVVVVDSDTPIALSSFSTFNPENDTKKQKQKKQKSGKSKRRRSVEMMQRSALYSSSSSVSSQLALLEMAGASSAGSGLASREGSTTDLSAFPSNSSLLTTANSQVALLDSTINYSEVTNAVVQKPDTNAAYESEDAHLELSAAMLDKQLRENGEAGVQRIIRSLPRVPISKALIFAFPFRLAQHIGKHFGTASGEHDDDDESDDDTSTATTATTTTTTTTTTTVTSTGAESSTQLVNFANRYQPQQHSVFGLSLIGADERTTVAQRHSNLASHHYHYADADSSSNERRMSTMQRPKHTVYTSSTVLSQLQQRSTTNPELTTRHSTLSSEDSIIMTASSTETILQPVATTSTVITNQEQQQQSNYIRALASYVSSRDRELQAQKLQQQQRYKALVQERYMRLLHISRTMHSSNIPRPQQQQQQQQQQHPRLRRVRSLSDPSNLSSSLEKRTSLALVDVQLTPIDQTNQQANLSLVLTDTNEDVDRTDATTQQRT